MTQTWKIARREFRGYFDHPTAYILVVAFLALALFLTFRSLYAQGLATLRPLFDYLPWLLAVFVPAITMRSLAEERRSGTLEWLLAQPLDEMELVAGKFLGDWLFVLVALAGTLPTAVGLLLLSEADPGILTAQYVGAGLLAAEMTALGLLASSVTRNQITAFILSAAAGFTLVLLGLDFTLMGFGPELSDVLGRLSLLTHFENIARGVLDLRDVLYFLTATGAFLAGTYFVVMRQRLSQRRGAYRRLRTGVSAVAVGVVVLNLLGGRIGGRLDLTRSDQYTLSEGTRRVVERLDDVATVKLFVSEDLPPAVQVTLRDVRDLLSDYERLSDGTLKVEELHPDESEEARRQASSLGIREIQFNVMRGDELQVKRGWLGLAVLHAGEEKTVPLGRNTSNLEYELTSTLATMSRERKPRIAFLTGYGARRPSGLRAFREAVSARYRVRSVSLGPDTAGTAVSDSARRPAGGEPATPHLDADSMRVAVLARPTRPLQPAALDALDGYLDEGGSLLVLAEGARIRRRGMTRPVEAGLGPFLERRGVRLDSGLVYDLRSNERVSTSGGAFSAVRPYPFWPVVRPASDGTVTRGLQAVTMAWARPVKVADSTRARPLLRTTEQGGIYPVGRPATPQTPLSEAPDQLSTRTVAVAVRGPVPASGGSNAGSAGASSAAGGEGSDVSGGRLVVIGDADFLDRRFVRSNPQNLAFAANTVDWLAQDEALIAIRSKDRRPPPLTFGSATARTAFKWLNLVGVPFAFVLVGGVRIVRRRRPARRQS